MGRGQPPPSFLRPQFRAPTRFPQPVSGAWAVGGHALLVPCIPPHLHPTPDFGWPHPAPPTAVHQDVLSQVPKTKP